MTRDHFFIDSKCKIKGEIKRCLMAYAPVLLGPVFLLGPLLARGQVLFWGTPALQFVPWWWAAFESIRQGSLPLWNPLNGMGAPLLANYQMAFFYPPNWLLLLLAAVDGPAGIALGYTLLTILHLIWAGLGMALLLRRLGMSWLAQVVGGMAFSLSGFIVGRLGFFSMTWAAAWLPWLIFFTDRLIREGSGAYRGSAWRFRLPLGLAACIAMLLLAGHAQLAWYSLLLAGAWLVVMGWARSGLRFLGWKIAGFAAAGLFGAVIAAVQLVPTAEYLLNSHRSDAVAYREAMTYSFWPWRFITLFSPEFFGSPGSGDYWGYASFWEDHAYVGLLPLLLALATLLVLLRGLRKTRRGAFWPLVAFLWVVLGITFVLALGENTPIFPFLYRYVPTFDMFQAPARYLYWATFALPVLAAVGIDRWRCPTGKGLYWFRLGTAGAFAVTLGAMLAWLLMSEVNLTFIRATALTGMWGLGVGLLTLAIPLAVKLNRMNLWRGLVIGWALLDLLAAGWSLNPGVGFDFYQRTVEDSAAERAVAGDHRVYLSEVEEYDLKFRRFLRFKDFSQLEDWRGLRSTLIPNLNLLDGVSLVTNFDPLVPERYARWMADLPYRAPHERAYRLALMNVGAVEHIDIRQPNGVRFDPASGGQPWRWYSCALPTADDEHAWKALEHIAVNGGISSIDPLVIEGWQGERGECSSTSQAVIRQTTRRGNQATFEVDTEDGGWLFLSNAYYPGWQARLDGQQAAIYPANYLFQAVHVPAGSHNIRLLYRPFGFYFGALFSILGLFIWMFSLRKLRGEKYPAQQRTS